MHPSLAHALRARRPAIRVQWEALLRAEPIATPLGHPNALIHLIDATLEEVFEGLAAGGAATSGAEAACPCRRNPLLRFFAAGDQALKEALILTQAAAAPISPVERDASLAELDGVLQHLARREIEAFCAICKVRTQEPAPAVAAQ